MEQLSNIKAKIASLLSNIKPIYIVILVVIIIAIEAVWAYQTIFKTSKTTPSPAATLFQQATTSNIISLTSPKPQFKIGEVIPVGINIESNKLTIGADLIIHYDPNLLSLTAASLKAPVTVGGIYDEYPLNQVDEKSGVIAVSGISSKTGGVTPKGLFGTILFQAKAAGSAKVFLEFTKDRTNDTNLIEGKTSTDVLEGVNNLDLKIIP